MRSPRITTRRLMAAVLGIGMALGLGLAAVQVYRNPEPHVHAYINEQARLVKNQGRVEFQEEYGLRPYTLDSDVLTPFWPRYRAYLMGRPWRKQPVCGAGGGHLLETCEFASPELGVGRSYGGWISINVPTRFWDEIFRRFPEWKDQIFRDHPEWVD